MPRKTRGAIGQGGRLVGVIGIVLHRNRNLFHAGSGFNNRRRLFLGTRGEVKVARRNFAGPAVHGVAGFADVVDDALELRLHGVQGIKNAVGIPGSHRDGVVQIPAGDGQGDPGGLGRFSPHRTVNLAGKDLGHHQANRNDA